MAEPSAGGAENIELREVPDEGDSGFCGTGAVMVGTGAVGIAGAEAAGVLMAWPSCGNLASKLLNPRDDGEPPVGLPLLAAAADAVVDRLFSRVAKGTNGLVIEAAAEPREFRTGGIGMTLDGEDTPVERDAVRSAAVWTSGCVGAAVLADALRGFDSAARVFVLTSAWCGAGDLVAGFFLGRWMRL